MKNFTITAMKFEHLKDRRRNAKFASVVLLLLGGLATDGSYRHVLYFAAASLAYVFWN